MPIDVSARFAFSLDRPSDVLLQFEAAAIPEQQILSSECSLPAAEHVARVAAQDAIGERIWLRLNGRVRGPLRAPAWRSTGWCPTSRASTGSPRTSCPVRPCSTCSISRYCPADRLQWFVDAEFGGLAGGARVLAMRDWIAANFRYVPGSSTTATTALDSFVERRGICRDYAHVLVTLARASTIPARYCSTYAPGVDPPDFHAVAEVFLADPTTPGGGAWYIVDATGMADPAETVKIGVGRDAADVSFVTVFGEARFESSQVRARKAA